ncbi:hypothetical protein DMC30DRAFT_416439 [Rhodotorula diobovata]|uniref:Uncharacterized protein n=1 Tax=Rhodotorula diobovata TaxID=5288 RepID=A0A5C5FWA2_9BASI|nr:hypothetical protein DMC30DRAFT_416439 [Rhodotorula diobovata]
MPLHRRLLSPARILKLSYSLAHRLLRPHRRRRRPAELAVLEKVKTQPLLAAWLPLAARQPEFFALHAKNQLDRKAVSGIGARNVPGQPVNPLYIPQDPGSVGMDVRGLVVHAAAYSALAPTLTDPLERAAATRLAKKTARRALGNFYIRTQSDYMNYYELSHLVRIAYDDNDDPFMILKVLSYLENFFPSGPSGNNPPLVRLFKILEHRLGHKPSTLRECFGVLDFSHLLSIPNAPRNYTQARFSLYTKEKLPSAPISEMILSLSRAEFDELFSELDSVAVYFLKTPSRRFIAYDVEAKSCAEWCKDGIAAVYYLSVAAMRGGADNKVILVTGSGPRHAGRRFLKITFSVDDTLEEEVDGDVKLFADALIESSSRGKWPFLSYSLNYLDERQGLSGLVEAGYVKEEDLPGDERQHMFQGLGSVVKVLVKDKKGQFIMTFINLGHFFRRLQRHHLSAPNMSLSTIFAAWLSVPAGAPPRPDPRLRVLPAPNKLGGDLLGVSTSLDVFLEMKASKCLRDVYEWDYIIRSLREIVKVCFSDDDPAHPPAKKRRVEGGDGRDGVAGEEGGGVGCEDEVSGTGPAAAGDEHGDGDVHLVVSAAEEARFSAIIARVDAMIDEKKKKSKKRAVEDDEVDELEEDDELDDDDEDDGYWF